MPPLAASLSWHRRCRLKKLERLDLDMGRGTLPPLLLSVSISPDAPSASEIVAGALQERLALQLHFSFEMNGACFGLMGAPPQLPGDDMSGLDSPLGELDGDAADFLDRPADQARRFVGSSGGVFLGGTALAWWRMAVIMAKASITSETCLCQPCQERVSL